MQKRVYFLRKLRDFKVSNKILSLFYKSVIESILTFGIITYSGNATKNDLNKLTRIVKRCMKITGGHCMSVEDLFDKLCKAKLTLILRDDTHPLHRHYQKLRSGVRLQSIRCRTSRFSRSFVPTSIRLHNAACAR